MSYISHKYGFANENMFKDAQVIKSCGALETGLTNAPECFKPAVNLQPGFRRWDSQSYTS